MASSTRPPHEQSATSAVTELLQTSRAQTSHPARRPAKPSGSSTAPPTPGSPSAATTQAQFQSRYALAEQTALEATADRQRLKREQALAELARPYSRRDLEQQIPRRYKLGDIYAPHDLSGTEMGKWRKMRRKPRVGSHGSDVLDSLGVDPREHYKNFSMMGEYVSEMGRIKHRSETGLRPVNQRRMAKAIRRAIGTGLMPSTYRHPELLRDDLAARGPRRA
ncbi:hypothetical protein LTR91_020997 [Friedmanniomyces endolithicus]|uniref:Small ribosomal subunit protein bS18m n=1 Tax=Friedmanniomyces endolithicus TaxID=329885 RepID=A0AAN6K0L1_9PEZI|nr:hypothetical protein LTR94_012690 [Friedmanniomyces endolithicus]KAK0777898.1 hypothetical protein LTR59_013701 [Friedmanniomyces endolithicus]KAK0792049.1 hypothetical protein LTR38_010001 [Friedmanniomyces endolithicus]KAK0815759.1 hypothetical protein LTR75_003710 [Friedmanniomyces endolithicus]KAK0825800.1 hypothetical protein LTR03_017344 [Friedmanniomyces endolithicus]